MKGGFSLMGFRHQFFRRIRMLTRLFSFKQAKYLPKPFFQIPLHYNGSYCAFEPLFVRVCNLFCIPHSEIHIIFIKLAEKFHPFCFHWHSEFRWKCSKNSSFMNNATKQRTQIVFKGMKSGILCTKFVCNEHLKRWIFPYKISFFTFSPLFSVGWIRQRNARVHAENDVHCLPFLVCARSDRTFELCSSTVVLPSATYISFVDADILFTCSFINSKLIYVLLWFIPGK